MRFVRTAENLFGLPQGFTRAETIESTGTQYIDTGVDAKTGLTIEAKIKYVSHTGIFCGAITTSEGTGDRYYAINFSQQNKVAFTYLDTAFTGSTTLTAGNIYTIKTVLGLTRQEIFVDGVSKGYTTKTDNVDLHWTLGLFALHRGGSFTPEWFSESKAILYYCKIWDGDTLVRYFIPCIDPLGVACIYDLVGKKPYYNKGTGTFTAGRQIIPVEYLEGTGTQYIDTGVRGFADFEIGVKLRESVSNVSIFCGNNYRLERYNATNPYWRFRNNNDFYNSGVPITEYHVMAWKNDEIYSDDVKLQDFAKTWNVSANMTLFGASASSSYPSMIYFCKLWNPTDGTLLRDYIPCKDENGNGFLFDKVSCECYLNSGTGDFAFGENKYTSKLRLIKEAVLLPDGYKRVDYLESTGTQWIDTGFIPTENTRTIAGLFTTSTANKNWFGSNGDSQVTKGCYCFNAFSATQIEYLFGNVRWARANAAVVNKVFTVDFSKNGIYIDNELVATPSYTDFGTGDRTMTLFVRNGGTAYISGRIYYLKMYDNGVLVRDFIPCLDPNNTPCMFDLVEGKPYYNQGTGDFTYGHTITPVEYLESTGTQYIDTGVGGDLTTEMTCEAAIVEAGNASVTNIMGNNVTNTRAITINMSANVTNPSVSRIRFGNTDNTTVAGSIDLNTFYKYDTNKNELTVRDSSGTVLNTYAFNATTAFTTNGNILIYKLGDTSTQYIGKIKVKSAKINNNGTLVRSFIPVRDENNVGYMFDEVTGQLFSNAGSGSFGIGNDLPRPKVRFIQDVIPSDYLPLNYLQSTGTQYIDLGVGVKSNTVFKATFSVASTATGRSYFGARNSTNERFQIVNSIGIGGGYYLVNTVYPIADKKYEIEMHANGDMYLDGVKRNASTGTFSQVTFARNLWLFATNYYDSSVGPGASTFWKVIIYEGDVPVRDLYPALRKSDNKPGMYDRITKQFFTNVAISGNDFNYG